MCARTLARTEMSSDDLTSELMTKKIPLDMLTHIAQKVEEPPIAGSGSGNAQNHLNYADLLSPTEHTFTLIVSNLLTFVFTVQYKHFPRGSDSIKYHIIGSRNDKKITLVVYYINLIEMAECESAMRTQARITDVRFQFTSLIDNRPMKYGCITVDIDTTSQQPVLQGYPEVPKSLRRERTSNVDWSNSVVLQSDRSLVLELIDDVCNLEARMPVNITQWLDGVYGTDCSRTITDENKHGKRVQEDDDDSNQRHNNASQNDEDGSEVSSVVRAPLVGYCISFTGLPSFNLAFLRHLKRKYETCWVSAIVIFPSGNFTQRLAITIRCHTALTQTTSSGVCTAKRIRLIIAEEFGAPQSCNGKHK